MTTQEWELVKHMAIELHPMNLKKQQQYIQKKMKNDYYYPYIKSKLRERIN